MFLLRLREENAWLEKELKNRTNQLIEEMKKVLFLESALMEYRFLGSVEYLRKIVEDDKKTQEKAGG